MNAPLAIVLLLLAVSALAVVGTGQVSEGPNLLTNGDCDADDGSGSPPDGWTAVSSNVQCTDPASVGDETPPDNSDAFTDFSGDNSDAVVEQEVDVTGGAEYNLSGEAGRGSGTTDFARIEVEFFDGGGSPLAGGITEEVKPPTDTYEVFNNTTVAPADAVTALVRITLVDVDGTSYSDAYVNEVEFREITTGITAFPVSGVETGVQGTLDPSWTLHDADFAESSDELGSEPATLVSFGGGDLAGDATSNPAGSNVSFAGGHLQVNSDGSFKVTNPTEPGTHTFDYRIEDSSSSDEASVTITVDDHTLHNGGCEATDGNNEPLGWTVSGAGGMACLDLSALGDTDHTSNGTTSFTADETGSVTAEQTVFVVPGEEYTLEGFYGTDAGSDYGEVELEYLDGNGDPIAGEGLTLSNLQSDTTTEFDRLDESSVAPAGATRATIRLSMVHDDAGTFAGVYFDNVTFVGFDPVPDAADATLPSVAIDDVLSESVLDAHGNGADHLGEPVADVASFGGGDLGGDATTHAAGATVALAGGNLTVESDGSLTLENHTEAGTYAFDYRLSNTEGSDDATVTLTVTDDAQVDVSFADATDSVLEGETLSLDVDAENNGTNTGYRNVSLEIEDESDSVVYAEEHEVEVGVGEIETLVFEWTTQAGDAGEYEVVVTSGDDSTTRTVSVHGFATVEGRVVDANAAAPAEVPVGDAAVSLRYPNGTEVETTTDQAGEFAVADVPATGEDYTLEVAAGGYERNATTVTVSGEGTVDAGTIELDGNATIAGTMTDAATTAGLAGATVNATADGVSYEAVTDATGAYTVEGVPGGQSYDVTISAAGYVPETSAGETVGDGATHGLDVALSGNASIEGIVVGNTSGVGIENASVTVTYPSTDSFTVENATDENGAFSIDSVPGTGDDYDLTVSAAGFDDAQESVTVDDGTAADAGTITLSGSAAVSGTITDATFETGIGGVEVTIASGPHEYTPTTDADGEYAVPALPGERSYDVSVDPDGWDANSTTIAVGDGETVSDANLTLAGTGELSATVSDDLLVTESTDDGALGGATVTVEHSTFGSVAFASAADGAVGPVTVPGGATYTATATAAGYHPETNASVPTNSSVEFRLAGNATIQGNATDAISGDGIENATLAVEYPGGEAVTVENATAADGSYTIAGVAGTGGAYDVTAAAAGYLDETATIDPVDDGTTTRDLELLPVGDATVVGNATDATTGSPIEDANVTVELDDPAATGDAAYEATTAGDGEYEVAGVIGGYDYTVTVAVAGYEDASESGAVAGNATTRLDVEPAGNATVSGTITDELTGDPIENATVTATGGQGAYEADTDAAGSYTIAAVPGTGEDYAVSTSVEGYAPTDTTVTLGDDEDAAGVDLALAGDAVVVVTITDGATGAPIGSDANVTVENATYGPVTVEDASPNGADEYRVAVPGSGADYDVSVEAAGYDAGTTHATGPLGSGETATVAETLLGAATIAGNVTDDATGAPVANATVTATGGAGAYTAETAGDGSYTVEDVPGTGESFDVTATARTYRDADATVAVPESGATLDVDLVKRARFVDVDGVIVPATVRTGSGFEIRANVSNPGATAWNTTVEFEVGGVVVGNESVDLSAGNETVVGRDHAIGAVGGHEVVVRSANASANATVTVVPRPSPPPAPPGDDPDEEPDEETTVVVTPRNETGGVASNVSVRNVEPGRPVVIDLDRSGNATGDDGRDDATLENVSVSRLSVNVSSGEAFTLTVTTYDATENEDANEGFLRETGATSAGYVVVNHSMSDDSIEDVTFQFRVRKTYLERTAIPGDTVALYRNETVRWRTLDTELVGETDTHYVYEATSPGLSVFVIGSTVPVFGLGTADLSAETVTVGEEVSVTASVENRGGADGVYEASLLVDGERVGAAAVPVDAFGEASVTLAHTFDDPGTYELAIGDRVVGTVTVEAAATTAEPTPEPTTVDPTTTTTDDPEDTGRLGAIILLLVVVLAAAAAVYLSRR